MYLSTLSILPQSVFNRAVRVKVKNFKLSLSILPQSVFNATAYMMLRSQCSLSILPQSVFNRRDKRGVEGNKSFQSYLSPCLTQSQELLINWDLFLSILPQSVFNRYFSDVINALKSFFQSYLSPCLTLASHACASLQCRSFQSYLSPCLTSIQYESKLPLASFNPTLVRV